MIRHNKTTELIMKLPKGKAEMLLSELITRKQAKVLSMRLGLDFQCPKTLTEIGIYYSVSKERIRQIEAKALRIMRHPSRLRKIHEMIGLKFEGKIREDWYNKEDS